MAGNKDIVEGMLNNLKTNMKKDGVAGRPEIAQLALSAESMDQADVKLAGESTKSLHDSVTDTIALLSNEEGFKDVTFEPYQIDAAKKVAAIAIDPTLAIESFQNLKSPDGKIDNTVDAIDLGVEDMLDPGALSAESFDNQAINNAIYFSIASTLIATRQDEFGETFYPSIVIDANAAGIAIETEYTSLFNSFERSITGSADKKKFNKSPLIKSLYDYDKFGGDKNRVVPVLRDENKAVLLEDCSYIETVAEEKIETAPIKFGENVSLLGLSQTNALLAKGIMDETDTLDRTLNLSRVYYSVVNADNEVEKFFFDASIFPLSNFTYSTQDHEKDLALSFQTDSVFIDVATIKTVKGAESKLFKSLPANHKIRLTVSIMGNGNTAYGDVQAFGANIGIEAIYNAADEEIASTSADYVTIKNALASLKLEGWTPEAYRTNSNLRTKGHQITSDKFTQLYTVPLRSGITVTSATNNVAGGTDVSKLTSQIQILGLRVSMDAVKTLVEYAGTLKQVVGMISNNERIGNIDLMGVGRHHINPYFQRDTIKLDEIVDSSSSKDRSVDIKAALENRIKDEVLLAYTVSNYSVANDVKRGNLGKKVSVIIGCNHRIKQYLTQGGNIDLGEQFEAKVVATTNPMIGDSIYITFGVFDGDRNTKPNDLNFGQCVWSPTVTVDANRTVNNASVRELHTIPRYLHITNLPLMIVLDVTDIQGVLGKVAAYRTSK